MTPVVLDVGTNDDPTLSCFFCRTNEHVPRPLALTLYTTDGRSTWGVHQRCYERAVVPVLNQAAIAAAPPTSAGATERGETCTCGVVWLAMHPAANVHRDSCPLYRKEPPK